jgi:hypothetical protein
LPRHASEFEVSLRLTYTSIGVVVDAAGPLVVVVKDTWSVRTVTKQLGDEDAIINDASDAFITIC